MTKTRKKPDHYVDNKKLLTVMIEYKRLLNESKENDTEPPQIPNYVGICLMDIAQRLSNKPNFRNYPFRDEMMADGVETCIKYIYNFDPDKSNNPFAYFTSIIYYAFLNRIKKEKKELYTKQKSLQNLYFQGLLADQDILNGSEHSINVDLDNPYMNELVESIDTKKDEKKKAKSDKKVKVEKFYETGDE